MEPDEQSLNQVLTFLKQQKLPFRLHAPLSEFTTFRLGGECPCIVFCEKPLEVVNVIKKTNRTKYRFLSHR